MQMTFLSYLEREKIVPGKAAVIRRLGLCGGRRWPHKGFLRTELGTHVSSEATDNLDRASICGW